MEKTVTATTALRPGFDEMMLAMDAVDTIRHETSALEAELSDDERRDALKARLREYYAGQGIEVPDEILAEAVDGVGRDRFVFRPLEPGLPRLLATAWVRRGRYLRRTAASLVAGAALLAAASAGYETFVVAPRERAAAELEADLSVRLPLELDKAYAEAAAAAKEYGDEAAGAVVASRRDEAARLIEAGDRDGARQAVASLERMGDDIRRKIAVAVLVEKAKASAEDARSKPFDTAAKAAMEPVLRRLQDAAATGDAKAFAAAERALSDFVRRVETPLEIVIVDREGVRSGVWRTNDAGRTRVHYLIVEALDPSGRPMPMEIRSFETGRTRIVTHWGVRVPEREYNRVGEDKAMDGVIDRAFAGRKPAGSLDFVWEIPVSGQMITEW